MNSTAPRRKTGPKPENGIHRVRLCGGGPWVQPETLRLLRFWRDTYNVPIGRAIDSAIQFSIASKDFYLTTKTK